MTHNSNTSTVAEADEKRAAVKRENNCLVRFNASESEKLK